MDEIGREVRRAPAVVLLYRVHLEPFLLIDRRYFAWSVGPGVSLCHVQPVERQIGARVKAVLDEASSMRLLIKAFHLSRLLPLHLLLGVLVLLNLIHVFDCLHVQEYGLL